MGKERKIGDVLLEGEKEYKKKRKIILKVRKRRKSDV